MNMPGFTAEESFYKANGHYRTTSINVTVSTQVVPQLGSYICAKACAICERWGHMCGVCDKCWSWADQY